MRKSATNLGIYGRRNILGASMLALSASLIANGAMAQEAAPAAGEVVIVTGIRKGLQDSVNAKRVSTQIGDGVNAEDIGKLPDVSIAESIARLPGIAAQRTNGRAQSLSVRGLGPDYTVTTLNGREQVSTNDNRSVEFDQYPSELINAVFVYKTPNASMVNQGVAGTADLQTVRPLTFGRRVFAVSARREQNSEDAAIGGYENFGNRFSATYIDTFMDGTVGVALGFAHTTSPYQATKDEPWGDGNLASQNGAFLPGGQKNQVQSSNLKRDGLMGVLEFRPNDRLHITIDGYHSDFKEIQQIARLEYPLAWGGATLASGVLSSDGKFYNSGTFTGVKVIVENYANRRTSQIDEIGFNLNYDISDNWSVAIDANSQRLSRTDLILETTAGTGPNGVGANDTVNFLRGANNSYTITGALDYTSFDNIFLTDPKGWGGSAGRAGYVKNPTIDDELSAIRLSATRTIESSLLDSVTFGFNQTTHTKSKVNREGAITLPGLVSQAQVPAAYRRGTTDASFLGNGKGMIAYDALGLYDSGYYGFSAFTGDNDKKNWSVDETIQTAYIMANIDTEFAGMPVTGNVGLQYVHSDQSATSAFVSGVGGSRYVTDGADYSDTLPSINLNFEVAENLKVRLGAATTIARPRMDDLSTGTGYGVTLNTGVPSIFQGSPRYWSGGGGNAQLRPWKSNSFDISVEKYFGRRGYISAALFYKDITSFIYSATVLKDYTGAPLPAYCYDAGGAQILSGGVWICSMANTNRIGTTGGQTNGSAGYINGMELALSLPFEMITPALDGFGLIASASFNNSSINPTGTGEVAIPGLSEQIINTTIYYEKHGFSARLSNRYRGDFVGEVPDYTNSLQTRNVRSESILDAQLGYTFQSGPANGLNLSFSASNITNEPFFMYQGDNVVREEKYGATYMFGASYRF
ncbi:MAG: TonB-dependent receptor [Hyphomonadaceae bacterium]|nr:MAG: TonB-dependent receptor [Hyphomonadaceae bacterium]KAF0185957.1 MAG: TonB-dependent receptor [Hyphomonadaceae bacterium]